MKLRVTAHTAADLEPVVEENCDRLSFIDNDSHGPMTNFGINASMEVGQKVAYVAAPNVSLVTAERTE